MKFVRLSYQPATLPTADVVEQLLELRNLRYADADGDSNRIREERSGQSLNVAPLNMQACYFWSSTWNAP